MQGIPAFSKIIIMVGLICSLAACTVPPLMHRGGIMVDSWAEVKADPKTVADILGSFNQSEAALQEANLDQLMNLYSDNYQYHGLTKQDLRGIWADLLAHNRDFKSNHILSRIVASSEALPTAELTCTGSLWAVSKETGEQVRIDSWYGEVHYMVNEDGTWRVRGHRGQAPSTKGFGAAPHPFF